MKAKIEAIKLGLQTLVYAAILALIASLFIRPDITAQRAGAFFKAFQDNNINIRIAALGFNISAQEVQELTEQSATLDQVKLAAVCLADGGCSAQQQTELAVMLQVEAVEQFVAQKGEPETRDTSTPPGGIGPSTLVPEGAPVVVGDWVVVLGADRDLAAARDEQRQISARTDRAVIELVLRDGWFRTVAFFDSAAQAEAALGALEQAARRKGVYARATAIWCTGRILAGEDGVIECG